MNGGKINVFTEHCKMLQCVKCTLFAALRQNATKMILGNNCPAME
jgi:hypothetical protein